MNGTVHFRIRCVAYTGVTTHVRWNECKSTASCKELLKAEAAHWSVWWGENSQIIGDILGVRIDTFVFEKKLKDSFVLQLQENLEGIPALVIKAVNVKILKCVILNKKYLYLVIWDLIETVWNIF